ncbi:GntR family transcriptional regulator [Kitasatospora sp. NA04385]|uniref:GntR family transcriptional regulator n=1 Tax=Kitasatospora sp. NA04385 TaxID=2742135 RepID=UPI00158FA680|nr:GntR family transcriptional regulator [Kitasatospora sp. NA04385]QKW19074.1 GntR family transcriptional regulator [Kitasatospora sp. NA04385]
MTTSGPSAYLQVAEQIRDRIAAGEYPPGSRLPSLADLQEQYGFSHGVGQSAYRLLEQEGVVLAQQGRGYFVREQEAHRTLVRRRPADGAPGPDNAFLAEQGVTTGLRSQSTTEAATADVAERLGVEAGTPLMHTTYVYLVDGEPGYLADSWEPMAVTGRHLIVLPEAGPYIGLGVAARMAVIGIEVGEPVELVTARGLTRAEAQTLALLPGAPALAIRRTHYDQATGRPVETADLVLPGERWSTQYGRRPGA